MMHRQALYALYIYALYVCDGGRYVDYQLILFVTSNRYMDSERDNMPLISRDEIK